MKNALRWACQDLRRFLQLDEANRQQFLYATATAFTRCRQLTFERTAVLVLSLLKKTLSIELFDFFRALKLDTATKSAFVQARRKLKAVFFTSFFLHTTQVFYRRFPAKRWKGFRLWACDGAGLRLPNEAWVGNAFGWHQNQHSRAPSIGLGYLKRFLPALLPDGPKQWWARVKELLALLLSVLEPIRTDKNRVRKKRLMRGAERHIYEPNYKPSL